MPADNGARECRRTAAAARGTLAVHSMHSTRSLFSLAFIVLSFVRDMRTCTYLQLDPSDLNVVNSSSRCLGI